MMSKSNTATDVIRKASEIAAVRKRLIVSELSVAEKGWLNTSHEAMLDRFKERAIVDGKL